MRVRFTLLGGSAVLLLAACVGGGAPDLSSPTSPTAASALRAPGPAGSEPPGTGVPSGAAVTVALVGDSLTAALSPDFDAGVMDPAGWAAQLFDERFRFAGGWASWGATTEAMLREVPTVSADVLVVLAGTNDLLSVPFGETAANLDGIVAKVSAERVVVSAIPPFDPAPDAVQPFNQQLEALVRDRGWRWVPPVPALGADGRFATGMSYDGVHLTADGGRALGQAIRDAVEEEVSAAELR